MEDILIFFEFSNFYYQFIKDFSKISTLITSSLKIIIINSNIDNSNKYINKRKFDVRKKKIKKKKEKLS